MNPGGPDYSYSALNGLTRAPDGTITYDFDGHVHARGLDLDATDGSDLPAPADHKVRWLSQANGAVVADISAWEQTVGTPSKHATLAANHNGHQAELSVAAYDPSVDLTAVTARAGDDTVGEVTIIDDKGFSSFLQIGAGVAPSRAVLLGGFVASNGAKVVDLPGGSFSSARTGVGLYTITFTEPYGSIPAFAVLTAQAGVFGARATGLAAGSVAIATYNSAFANADAQFVFLAYGLA